MKKTILLTILLILTMSINAQIHCVMDGIVKDRPQSESLVLIEQGGDPRINIITIPIKDGKFHYEIDMDFPLNYELIFSDELANGSFNSISFMMEDGNISFELYPQDEYDKDIVIGGKLNQEYTKLTSIFEFEPTFRSLRDSMRTLMDSGQGYAPRLRELRKQMDEAMEAKDRQKADSLYSIVSSIPREQQLTPEAQELFKRGQGISDNFKEWQMNYLQNNLSPVTIAVLYSQLNQAMQQEKYGMGNKDDIVNPESLTSLYKEKYMDAFPLNPYHEKISILINGAKVKVGASYPDFTAPDLQGVEHTLSKELAGSKIALIDLWASWCGPCIRSAVAAMPIYEKYKDKGFTIVGVARESLSTDAMKKVIEQHKFPWLNLVELNDAAKIWIRYGIATSGGGTFLVNKDGKILAVNPSAEELETKIKEALNIE